jgi:uncharacterized repeat protein (TIGR01451 family)
LKLKQQKLAHPVTLLRGLLLAVLFVVQSAALAAPPQYDLAIAKVVNNALPREGDTIVYTLTLSNIGTGNANQVEVTDVLPIGVTYVSDDLGTYDPVTGVWTAGQLKAGDQLILNITATVDPGTLGNTITNIADITNSNITDSVPGNDSSSVDLTVIEPPSLTIVKSALTTSDPVNGASSPYNIPGATLLYSLQTTNTGLGVPDTDSMLVTDPIPANTELFVNDLGGAGSGPVLFIDGTAPVNSGLTYTFTSLGSTTDDLEFSNDNGATWTYTPVPDASGYDANVTNIRVNPKGVMRASDGTNNPTYSLRFQVRVK